MFSLACLLAKGGEKCLGGKKRGKREDARENNEEGGGEKREGRRVG